MRGPSRRRFLIACAALIGGGVATPRSAVAASGRVRRPHPTPRPGVTGARVLTRAQLADAPGLVGLFDGVRAIPEVVDGIRCNCGCADAAGYYSLLTCYEGDAMAKGCPICQGQGRLAVRLHREGKTLDEIRVAIDAKYA